MPVVLHEAERYSLGGAANVALNIKALGAQAHLVAVVGTDAGAQQLQQQLEREGLSADCLLSDPSRRTTKKTRIMARHQQLLRYDVEDTHPLDPVLEEKVLQQVQTIAQQHSIGVLVLQDYNKGVLTPNLITALIAWANDHNIVTLADPKKANFLSYKGVDWFKPNLREVNEALEISLDDRQLNEPDLQRAATVIRHTLANRYTLITLGEQGLFVATENQSLWATTKARAVADVCGAGDTVISVVALCAGAGLSLETTLQLANLAGGQVCEHVGVVPVNKAQLWAEFQQNNQKTNKS